MVDSLKVMKVLAKLHSYVNHDLFYSDDEIIACLKMMGFLNMYMHIKDKYEVFYIKKKSYRPTLVKK